MISGNATPDAGGNGPSWERVSIVVAAYNEEDGITTTLRSLIANAPGAEIIVVDDGSTDQTSARVGELPAAKLIRHRFNRGQSAALKTGVAAATRPLLAWFDADNEHRVEDLSAMVMRIEREKLAAVIGQRAQFSGPMLRAAGKWLIRMLAASLKFRAGHDVNCGLRVFQRDVILPYLSLLPDRYSASLASTFIMVERGYPIAFHAVELNRRVGTSKVRVMDGLDAMIQVLRLIMLFAPLRIFLTAGLLLITAGSLYGFTLAAIAGRGLPTSSVLAILAGLMLCLQGFIADQISQTRLSQLRNIHPIKDDAGS
jgi:glycosyltransferase involved in cell wall biosynthesis